MTIELRIPMGEDRSDLLAILGTAGYPVHVEKRTPDGGLPWHDDYYVVIVENVDHHGTDVSKIGIQGGER